MGAKLGSGGGPMADINVTPLIDVVLVLLVVFMVITPMLESGMPVDLPVSTQTTEVRDTGQFVIVSVTADGKWFVEQDEVTASSIIDAINGELMKRTKANPKQAIQVLVKGDTSLTYRQVREVMDLIAEEGGIRTVQVAANRER